MNNKIIAAGVVVALCAVALIGVGYAYTATMTSENNTVESQYIVLDIAGTGKAEAIFNAADSKVSFNTETTSAGTKWTPSGQISNTDGKNLKITGSNVGATEIKLDLTTSVTSNTFTDEVLKHTKIKFTNTTSSAVIEYSLSDSTWSCGSSTFVVGGEYDVSLEISEFTATSALSPTNIVFSMTLSYDSNPTPSP